MRHDDSMRPYGESCTASAHVRPPPGCGAIRKRSVARVVVEELHAGDVAVQERR